MSGGKFSLTEEPQAPSSPRPATQKTGRARTCHLGLGKCTEDGCMAWDEDEGDCLDIIERQERAMLFATIREGLPELAARVLPLFSMVGGAAAMQAEAMAQAAKPEEEEDTPEATEH